MGMLGSVIQNSIEKKFYTVDYSCWLGETETIVDFFVASSPSTSPALISDGSYATPDFKKVISYISKGKPGTIYTISFITVTNMGQTKRDDLRMQVT